MSKFLMAIGPLIFASSFFFFKEEKHLVFAAIITFGAIVFSIGYYLEVS